MKSEEDQVTELNVIVKTRIAPSKIHGVGIFALRDITKGEKLYGDRFARPYRLQKLDKLRPEVKELLLAYYPSIITGSPFIYPNCLLQTYMNHAEGPNYDGVTDMTLVDIKEGEEITENYRRIAGANDVFPWLN